MDWHTVAFEKRKVHGVQYMYFKRKASGHHSWQFRLSSSCHVIVQCTCTTVKPTQLLYSTVPFQIWLTPASSKAMVCPSIPCYVRVQRPSRLPHSQPQNRSTYSSTKRWLVTCNHKATWFCFTCTHTRMSTTLQATLQPLYRLLGLLNCLYSYTLSSCNVSIFYF